MCQGRDDDDCAVCDELQAHAQRYADVCEVTLEGVVVSRVRGQSAWRTYALAYRPDLTRG